MVLEANPKITKKEYFFVHIGCPVLKDLELTSLYSSGVQLLIIDDVGIKPRKKIYHTYVYENFESIEKVKTIINNFKVQTGLKLGHIFTLAEGSIDFTNILLEEFSLPRIYEAQIPSIRDKYEMRVRLQKFDKHSPFFKKIENLAQLQDISENVFPIIVKPVDSMESRSVSLVRNQNELELACKKIFNGKTIIQGDHGSLAVEDVYQLQPFALLETYIEGYEYSCEAVVNDGKLVCRFITLKRNSDFPHFYENGHTSGLEPLTNDEDQKLTDLINSLISANLYKFTFLHIEFRLTREGEIFLIECNSRLAGDQISDLIDKSYSINLLEEFLVATVEKRLPKYDMSKPTLTTRFYLSTEKEGIFSRRFNTVADMQIDWRADNGTKITHLATEGVSRVGSVCFQSPTEEKLKITVEKIYKNIHSTFSIQSEKQMGLDLSVYIRRQVSRWYFRAVVVLAIFIAIISSALLWVSQTQYLKFFGKNLSDSLIEYVVAREILPVAQKIHNLGLQQWCSKIVVTDQKFGVIYSSGEEGLPSYLVFREVDPSAFEYKFPIQSNGIIQGYLLLSRNYYQLIIPTGLLLMLVMLTMTILYLVVTKGVLPKSFQRVEFGIKRMADLLIGLQKELKGLNSAKFNTGLVLETYRSELDSLPAEFSEINALKSVTQGMLDGLKRLQSEIEDKNKLSALYSEKSREVDTLNEKMILDQEHRRIMSDFAAQVAHDIRSPLAALDMVNLEVANKLPEEIRILIRHAIGRIRDIANGLVQKNSVNIGFLESPSLSALGDTASVELIPSHLEAIVSEARFQFKHREDLEIEAMLSENSYSLFASIQPLEFNRVISNLINNSAESIKAEGKIQISLTIDHQDLVIKISDTGNGIEPEIIPLITNKGVTHGKTGGTGLGLYHAKNCVESWGGSLEIMSQVGKGTTIIISIPSADAPSWFKKEIVLKKAQYVVVVDDDVSIHQVWRNRFEKFRGHESLNFKSFLNASDFRDWWNKETVNKNNNYFFLFDYELIGLRETGLDFIEEYKLQNRSCLVTSHFHESNIRSRCERLGVTLIPKGLAPFIPIRWSR